MFDQPGDNNTNSSYAKTLRWLLVLFIAAIGLMGAVGGSMIGIAPRFTIGLFEGLICPGPDEMLYDEVRYSYHEPGERTPIITCVEADGSAHSVTGRAILITLGMIFLCIFILLVTGQMLLQTWRKQRYGL